MAAVLYFMNTLYADSSIGRTRLIYGQGESESFHPRTEIKVNCK